ncbi:hypothetical protein [Rubripirellula obstinata]|nr:hypothetical protein [Rubripirellula obstinata]
MTFVRIQFVAVLMLVVSSATSEEPAATPFRLPETSGGQLLPAGEEDLPSWLQVADTPSWSASTDDSDSETDPLPITQAIANVDPQAPSAVTLIPSYSINQTHSNRVVRYEVPLDDTQSHADFASLGVQGKLMSIEKEDPSDRSSGERWRGFLSPMWRQREAEMIQVVRYEVPADQINFHAQMQSSGGRRLTGEIVNHGFMPMPEVRFFQPKARVFMDLKSGNDSEFDLFADGAILASLDVIELHFPMPLISERFGELLGTPSQLSNLGWRVGGTVGLGIATALNNGTENGSAPVTTLSSGIRYEFPLGRPSREVLETGDLRLDQRTRVGIELGIQGGISTRESLSDKTDVGMYFGFQVDTPWGG